MTVKEIREAFSNLCETIAMNFWLVLIDHLSRAMDPDASGRGKM